MTRYKGNTLLYLLMVVLMVSMTIIGCVSDEPTDDLLDNQTNSNEGINQDEVNDPLEVVEVEPILEVINTDPVYDGHLNLSIGNPTTLNPIENTLKSIDVLLKLVYEPLFAYDETLQPQPVLVEAYTYNMVNKAIEITLKSDVTFHYGETLISEDVRYTIEQIKKIGGIYSQNVANIQYIDVVDDLNLIIYFKEHYAFHLDDLTFPIVSKSYITGDTYDSMIANGTGFYKVDEVTQMQNMTLSYYDLHRGDEPYISTIACLIVRDEAAQDSSFDQNLVDLFVPDTLNWKTYSDLNVKTFEYTTNYLEFLGFNFTEEKVLDVKVRQAIAKAIDREAIMTIQYLNHGVITDSLLHPDHRLNKEPMVFYTLDDDAAKDLLSVAGYEDLDSNGFLDGKVNAGDFTLKLIVSETQPLRCETATLIANDLKAIGIHVEISELSQVAFTEALTLGDYDMFLSGWKMTQKPDYIPLLHSQLGRFNMNAFNSLEMDRALETIYLANSPEQLATEFRGFNNLFAQELPYFLIGYINSAVIAKDTVYGELNPSSDNLYQGLEQLYIINK